MRKMTFCGATFEMMLPSFLPKWANDRLKDKFASDRNDSICHDFEGAEKFVDSYLFKFKMTALGAQVMFHEVKISKGKSDLSVKAEIVCLQSKVNFYAPKSMLISLENKHFLPYFFVKGELEMVKKRSIYKSQQYDRTPSNPATFPDEFLQALKKEIISKIPSQELFDDWNKSKIEAAEISKLEREIENQKRNLKIENDRAIIAKRAETDKKRRTLHFAKLETRLNVSVEWVVYTKSGKNQRIKKNVKADNATIKFSGARAYIFLIGREEPIITTTKNVIIND